MDRYGISVAMAAYNGEKFIREQIASIMKQLGSSDELVVSYNPCTDNTVSILNSLASSDPRIRVIECSEKGVIANFENAIKNCRNEIIFLTDQDDVWKDGKVETVMPYFKDEEIGCVVHCSELVDSDMNYIGDNKKNVSKQCYLSPFSIVFRNKAQGSCMAFRKAFENYVLPVPRDIPMHDSWIALIIATKSKVLMIPDKLLLYRQHGNNVSPRSHQKLGKMISDRRKLVKSYKIWKKTFKK